MPMPARAFPRPVTRTDGLLLPFRRYGLAFADDIHRKNKKNKKKKCISCIRWRRPFFSFFCRIMKKGCWKPGIVAQIGANLRTRQRTGGLAGEPSILLVNLQFRQRRGLSLTSLPKVRQFTSQGCQPRRRFAKHSPAKTCCFRGRQSTPQHRQSAMWFALPPITPATSTSGPIDLPRTRNPPANQRYFCQWHLRSRNTSSRFAEPCVRLRLRRTMLVIYRRKLSRVRRS